ncbi:MAG TPA: DUF3300 domain-containing protein [Candidatus Methylacidiphilales bacterium]|nr:DUF3300 domain-containing protein [Candidatus Methylacidiphilales bacterium]
MTQKARGLILGLALLGMIGEQTPFPLRAQETGAALLSPDQLDDLLAPIALYPDPLLAQILPASTSPTDIVMAARYVAAKRDPDKIDEQPWEESVKALARYPSVLEMMNEKLDWTAQLGNAFYAQPDDVFDSVQRLRAKADSVGNLKDTPQQVIVKEKEIIKIMPADSQVIYVPQYQPSVVYVQQPPSVAASLITFGAGFALGYWIRNEVNWYNRGVYYHPYGWHGGYYGHGNYYGGGNNINIDNSKNINIGNGNRGDSGSVWKPKERPSQRPGNGNNGGNWAGRPGGGNNNGNTGGNRPNLPGNGGNNDGNRPNPPGNGGSQTPGNRPSQLPANRPNGQPGAGQNTGQNRPNRPAAQPGQGVQQRPMNRPAQPPASRPSQQPALEREGTKLRPSPPSAGRPAPPNRGGGAGGRFGNR